MNLEPNTLMLALVHQATVAQQASQLPTVLANLQTANEQIQRINAELERERQARHDEKQTHAQQMVALIDKVEDLSKRVEGVPVSEVGLIDK